MDRPVFIEGKSINLVPLMAADAAACFGWLNDMETVLTLGSHPMPVSLEKQQEFVSKLYGGENS